jgi:hypothetical protein
MAAEAEAAREARAKVSIPPGPIFYSFPPHWCGSISFVTLQLQLQIEIL